MHSDELLTRGIETWREPVPVRTEWRRALLREIASAPPPTAAREPLRLAPRVWTLRPLRALAAAALILTIGLASGMYLSRQSSRGVTAAHNEMSRLTTVRFVLVAPAAREVSLVGDFNRWDVSANRMRLSRDGQSWVLELRLRPGRHAYAFVVDGAVVRDPAAPTLIDDDFGVRNSVVFVGGGRT